MRWVSAAAGQNRRDNGQGRWKVQSWIRNTSASGLSVGRTLLWSSSLTFLGMVGAAGAGVQNTNSRRPGDAAAIRDGGGTQLGGGGRGGAGRERGGGGRSPQGNFRLLDNGRPRAITGFSVEAFEAPGGAGSRCFGRADAA